MSLRFGLVGFSLSDATFGRIIVSLITSVWLAGFVWIFIAPFVPALSLALPPRIYAGSILASGFVLLLAFAAAIVGIVLLKSI